MQSMKFDPYHTPHIKINSKCCKDLAARIKTIKLLDKNLDINLHELELGSILLVCPLKHKKSKTNR